MPQPTEITQFIFGQPLSSLRDGTVTQAAGVERGDAVCGRFAANNSRNSQPGSASTLGCRRPTASGTCRRKLADVRGRQATMNACNDDFALMLMVILAPLPLLLLVRGPRRQPSAF